MTNERNPTMFIVGSTCTRSSLCSPNQFDDRWQNRDKREIPDKKEIRAFGDEVVD